MSSAVVFYPYAVLARGRGSDFLRSLDDPSDRCAALRMIESLGEGALEPVFGVDTEPQAFLAIRRDCADQFEVVVVSLLLIRSTPREARELQHAVCELAGRLCALPVLRVDVGATFLVAPAIEKGSLQ